MIMVSNVVRSKDRVVVPLSPLYIVLMYKYTLAARGLEAAMGFYPNYFLSFSPVGFCVGIVQQST